MSILVGTASWTDKSLIGCGRFYPKEASSAEARLRYYATQFPMVEVDSSYYAMPSAANAQLWAERTPADFVFNIKAFRLFTGHQTSPTVLPKDIQAALAAVPALATKKVLYYREVPLEIRDELWRRFLQALAPLQHAGKLRAVHFQYAPWVLRNREGHAHVAHCVQMMQRSAGIFIGPEFGTVQRSDLVEAARDCGDAGFDVLIACAFNYEAHATEFSKLGRIPVLKARMNADLHMAEDLKNTGKGNLFVIFGEPDIDILSPDGKSLKMVVAGKETYPVAAGDKLVIKVNGVDVFKPQTGEVISDGADGIACWFIDTDYNEESFFVRHAYFLGANDPYSALKTTLKAEIDKEAWDTLNSDTSRPFDKPKSGRVAVKVINHLGDEVMKVFKISKDEK